MDYAMQQCRCGLALFDIVLHEVVLWSTCYSCTEQYQSASNSSKTLKQALVSADHIVSASAVAA